MSEYVCVITAKPLALLYLMNASSSGLGILGLKQDFNDLADLIGHQLAYVAGTRVVITALGRFFLEAARKLPQGGAEMTAAQMEKGGFPIGVRVERVEQIESLLRNDRCSLRDISG